MYSIKKIVVYDSPNKERRTTMERGYKMRIYPNKEQAILINKTLGCSRFVFNQGLDNMKLVR